MEPWKLMCVRVQLVWMWRYKRWVVCTTFTWEIHFLTPVVAATSKTYIDLVLTSKTATCYSLRPARPSFVCLSFFAHLFCSSFFIKHIPPSSLLFSSRRTIKRKLDVAFSTKCWRATLTHQLAQTHPHFAPTFEWFLLCNPSCLPTNSIKHSTNQCIPVSLFEFGFMANLRAYKWVTNIPLPIIELFLLYYSPLYYFTLIAFAVLHV